MAYLENIKIISSGTINVYHEEIECFVVYEHRKNKKQFEIEEYKYKVKTGRILKREKEVTGYRPRL